MPWLAGVAASVRIATLPGELKAKDGDGVREVLAMADGESMLRQALEDAKAWQPEPEEFSAPEDGGDDWTNIKFDKGRTDRANSRRFLKQFRDRVRFVFPWNKWLIWTGTHWQIDDGGGVMRLAMAIADSVWFDARDFLTKDVVDFAVSTSGAGKLSAMLKLAAADVSIGVDELDGNPWLLNCPNGTVDLRTGELRPHRREDNLTKLCPTPFNPEASSYHWDTFLEGVFDNASTIEFVQRLFGHFLTGDVSEQIMPVFWGGGSNGKTTLLTAFQDTLGPSYTMAAPASLLTVKKTEAHPTELADLFGMRLIVAAESQPAESMLPSRVPFQEPKYLEAVRRQQAIVEEWRTVEMQIYDVEREIAQEPTHGPNPQVTAILEGVNAEVPTGPSKLDRLRSLRKKADDLEQAGKILNDRIHGGPLAGGERSLVATLNLEIFATLAPERARLLEAVFGALVDLKDSLYAWHAYHRAYTTGGGLAEGLHPDLEDPLDENARIHFQISSVRRAMDL